MSFAEANIGGRLTSDPEMKYVGDTPKTSFSIAHNKRYKDKEKVVYIDVEVWGPQAESVAEYKRRGDFVVVLGEIDMDEWEDRDSGKKRRKLFVHARKVDFGPREQQSESERPSRSRSDDRGSSRPRKEYQERDPRNYDDDLPF